MSAAAIIPVEREIISRFPQSREQRGQQLANQFVKFVGEMVPLLIQVRQDFIEKPADETICGVRTFDEYCTGILRYSRRRIQQLIAGQNPASQKHDGSAHRKPKTDRDQPDWTHEIYLERDAATELYRTMVDLPEWQPHRTDGSTAQAIYYGLSYASEGSGARNGEIPEIPKVLKDITDRIAAKVGMPVNYIQCHKYGPDCEVVVHPDPKEMIVPMLVLGQERTFRVGGKIFGKNGKPFPPMASQASMKNGTHVPEEEILLQHGSLLVFDGGHTLHSMLPADKDAQFNPNGFEWRISILFRYTTPAMREFGTRGAVEHGGSDQYEAAKREYRTRTDWNPAPANVEPKSEEPAPLPAALTVQQLLAWHDALEDERSDGFLFRRHKDNRVSATFLELDPTSAKKLAEYYLQLTKDAA